MLMVHYVIYIFPEPCFSKIHELQEKMWCNTFMYKPLVNHSLQNHVLREFWEDISYEIKANSPSGLSKKKYGFSSLCQHGNSRLHFEHSL
jgi:hypothetical protein